MDHARPRTSLPSKPSIGPLLAGIPFQLFFSPSSSVPNGSKRYQSIRRFQPNQLDFTTPRKSKERVLFVPVISVHVYTFDLHEPRIRSIDCTHTHTHHLLHRRVTIFLPLRIPMKWLFVIPSLRAFSTISIDFSQLLELQNT